MIDDAEQEMKTAQCVGFAGQVYAPDEVVRDGFWFGMFKITAQDLDFVVVLLQDLMDVGFADSNFAGGGETPVADVGDAAASGLRHKGFEADDFGFEPFGFLRGMAVVVSVIQLRKFAAVVRTMCVTHPTHDALEVRVQEFDDH